MDPKVRDYLDCDRQWLRAQRIRHAQWQLSQPGVDKEFWYAVLEALGD